MDRNLEQSRLYRLKEKLGLRVAWRAAVGKSSVVALARFHGLPVSSDWCPLLSLPPALLPQRLLYMQQKLAAGRERAARVSRRKAAAVGRGLLFGAGGGGCPRRPQRQPAALLLLPNSLFRALCWPNVIPWGRATRGLILKLSYIANLNWFAVSGS